ncbi:unnamed protein product, partial [Rotaria sp. Silwood1]
MPQTSYAKMEMIEECRQYYQNDPIELKKIDKFANEYYQSKLHTAIWWYTQDSFLYRRLNDACRTQDIDLIYTFRNFISDLLLELQKLHSKFYDDMFGIPIKAYRGQLISSNELNQLRKNIGKLYSTNTFLSTTGDVNTANWFANIWNPHPNFESVVFEYSIDTSIKTQRPYASIGHVSSKPREQEILLCMGTIFQLESIEQIKVDHQNNEYTYWYIKMKLVDENDDIHLASAMKKFEQSQNTPVLILLADLSRKRSPVSSDNCKAEQYIRLYLDEVLRINDEMDYKSRSWAYANLASICKAKGDYAASIEYSETIIKICLALPLSLWNKEEDEIMLTIRSAYDSLLSIYQYQTIDYDSIIKTGQQFLELLPRQGFSCLDCITDTLNIIGDAHKKLFHWSEALDCYKKA